MCMLYFNMHMNPSIDLRIANSWVLAVLLRHEAFTVRCPTKPELEVMLEAFNEKCKRLVFRTPNDMRRNVVKVQKLWSTLRRPF